MTSRIRRAAIAAALLASTLPSIAHATLFRAIGFDQKVENAASIVVGRCISQESKWDEARRWILTYSTFEVEKTIKGLPGQRITIVTPGGTVGNIRQETIGVPQFREGEENVVFVRNSAAGPTVLYFDQGNYHVVRDGRGEQVVVPAMEPSALVDSQRGLAVPIESPRTLREFEGAVRETMVRRQRLQMEMLEKRKREEESLPSVLGRNKLLILLAVAGAALATWQLVNRK